MLLLLRDYNVLTELNFKFNPKTVVTPSFKKENKIYYDCRKDTGLYWRWGR